VLIVHTNITKNNNLLSLAIQNKNIKANISHPPQRTKYNPNFSFFVKDFFKIKYGGSCDRIVGCITTYAISAHYN
jgi:hypothetical protein